MRWVVLAHLMDEEPKAQRCGISCRKSELMRGGGRFSSPQLSASLSSLHSQLGGCAVSLIGDQTVTQSGRLCAGRSAGCDGRT